MREDLRGNRGAGMLARCLAAVLALGLLGARIAFGATIQVGPGMPKPAEAFQVEKFVLPQEARVLVVVEGTGGSDCRVYAYEWSDKGWELRVETPGILGKNGMSNHRTTGDKTTPIGVFCMNTPFGQSEAVEGFPSDYIKVRESHVWSDDLNRLVDDKSQAGEHVGTSAYQGYYDYVLDAGFNGKAIPGQGSALFLHCRVPEAVSTGGCVAIPKEEMETVMKLYGTYGSGACFIAQASEGTFSQIYESYGVNDGLSPDGDFGV